MSEERTQTEGAARLARLFGPKPRANEPGACTCRSCRVMEALHGATADEAAQALTRAFADVLRQAEGGYDLDDVMTQLDANVRALLAAPSRTVN